MERACRLHGTALTYDLCYAAWDEATRQKVRTFLLTEARVLAARLGATDPPLPEPQRIVTVSAIGLAEMAVLADTEDAEAVGRIRACERAVTDSKTQLWCQHKNTGMFLDISPGFSGATPP